MARTLEDFVGKYTIHRGSGSFGIIEKGFRLCIGTGDFGDPAPDGLRIGVSVFDPGNRQRILPAEGHPAAFAYLVDGSLNGSTWWFVDDQPTLLAYQISLFSIGLPNGGIFRAPSLMVVLGDPQNVGVWGAEDGSGG